MVRLVIVIAALYGALGVALGAYQAHGMETALEARELSPAEITRRLDNARIAVDYQLTHALAMLAVTALSLRRASRFSLAAVVLFAVGTFLFSGGLVLHALGGQVGHPAIIPSGGILLIAGWIALAIHASCCWHVQATPIPDSLG